MRAVVTLVTISSLTLAGCSGFRDSRANPANWFGGGRSAPALTTDAAAANPLIPEERDSIFRRAPEEERYQGTPIHAVQEVLIEPSSGGAIIKATGLSLRQGAFDVRLVPENEGVPVDGVLSYTLRAVQRTDTPQGPEQTRRVSAGRFITAQTLREAREVRVLAQTNSAASVSRR
ncbi:hypothetical protein [Roseovarius aquimarinus]|uniref:Lipoprotein n=1 Tax=Roseovarius aquimarinus TaxID=1229156 RepID=A0ABW7I4U8_9RHOB